MIASVTVTVSVGEDDDLITCLAVQAVADALDVAGLAATVSARLTPPGVDPRDRSGYYNRQGRRVPYPPCGFDSEGRDLDRIYRNIKPGDRWDKTTLDPLAAGPL